MVCIDIVVFQAWRFPGEIRRKQHSIPNPRDMPHLCDSLKIAADSFLPGARLESLSFATGAPVCSNGKNRMARVFLAIVGAAYLVLAAWCAILPDTTSASVGFALQPGAGQSEFLTVYGGLQVAIGLAFLWPIYRPSDISLPLLLCLLIHGCLVAFRTLSFGLYSGVPATTMVLAATEWIIFIGAAILWSRSR